MPVSRAAAQPLPRRRCRLGCLCLCDRPAAGAEQLGTKTALLKRLSAAAVPHLQLLGARCRAAMSAMPKAENTFNPGRVTGHCAGHFRVKASVECWIADTTLQPRVMAGHVAVLQGGYGEHVGFIVSTLVRRCCEAITLPSTGLSTLALIGAAVDGNLL